MIKPISCLVLLNFVVCCSQAQMPLNGLDVGHYRFEIFVNDSTDRIKGIATITFNPVRDVEKVCFDLVSISRNGKGMKVINVSENGTFLQYSQDSQHLIINKKVPVDEERVYKITYEGVPGDGLIIGINKYGHRTFFADNWPDRAHYWIPCNDHVSDKATVDFIVTAPAHYKVISNGIKTGESLLPGGLKLTHYSESSPLPTKIMVIGIADFSVQEAGLVGKIPVSSWVYPEDSSQGFHDYSQAVDILPFFIRKIGPFPFEKLANVESRTIYGGMENAGAIFYSESSINVTQSTESLLAHEISHQWFGDAVSESDWPHIWLSEGFATYMTNLYLEENYGRDSLNSILIADRRTIVEYSRQYNVPVVDTTQADDLTRLLNINSYQKGGWILHMLRGITGDSLFWKSCQVYYSRFTGKNAGTRDLQDIFEEITRTDLKVFFRQWLNTPGQPSLNISWKYIPADKKVIIKIDQVQKTLFDFPLELGIKEEGKIIIRKYEIKDSSARIEFTADKKPIDIIPDPNVNLLFEAGIKEIH
jgi:aminopeptidase N